MAQNQYKVAMIEPLNSLSLQSSSHGESAATLGKLFQNVIFFPKNFADLESFSLLVWILSLTCCLLDLVHISECLQLR